ncbi:MAG: PD40 domain-containing protein [Bacteroidetes bacterium]|nr:PD40 domain-containing protein [Bacteroidota bacterium]
MRKLLACVLVVIAFNSKAQVKAGGSYKDYFQEGSFLLLEDNFSVAQENFDAAYQIDSTNANINYLLGITYLHSPTQKVKAEGFLAKAITNISRTYKNDNHLEKAAPPLAHYFYGQALHINYKFDEATAQYDNFAKFVNAKDKDWKKMLDKEKAECAYAKELAAAPLNIQITNLGDSINSQYPEYSPVLSADERMLIYTTRRPNTTGGLKDINGVFNEDVVVAYKDEMGRWSSPQPISANINSSSMEASINLTPDGQTLILYKDGGDGMGGNIYYSTFDGKDWSTLKEFGSNVNTKYWESHACLSADGNVLFFVSDRPGGLGGRDIYRCIKLPNGKWSKALNMGPTINTEYDEDGAFIHPDGKTFFFASKGHKTMGGFDIMFASLNEENQFTDVSNIGYPINTTDDDVFYIASPDGKRGYFSSAKEGSMGEKDIYMISIPEAKEKPLALFKGQIIPSEGDKLPDDILIVVRDKQTGEVIGTYRPKMVNGTFSTILPPGKEYNFSYQTGNGEEFYNEDVFVTNELTYTEIKREVNLEPVKLLGKVKARQKTIILNALVFDNNKNKKAVSGAKLTLQEEGGATQTFDVNQTGKQEGIELKADKKYSLFAEADGKKSVVSEINTKGVKSGKVINQVVYMSGKADKTTTKDLVLDVIVKNAKTKKIIPNATVTLTDADGNKVDVTTDAKGAAKDIELSPDMNYGITASNDGNVSESVSFSTKGAKGKRISKTVFVGGAQSGNTSTASSNSSPSRYEFFFKYNVQQNDDDAEWIAFVDNIVELSKKRTVQVSINASASRVPTRVFNGNNKKLASARANKLQERVKEAVEAKGGNVKKLRFSKKYKVGGPKYRGDHELGRAKYEKHQFVKARAR